MITKKIQISLKAATMKATLLWLVLSLLTVQSCQADPGCFGFVEGSVGVGPGGVGGSLGFDAPGVSGGVSFGPGGVSGAIGLGGYGCAPFIGLMPCGGYPGMYGYGISTDWVPAPPMPAFGYGSSGSYGGGIYSNVILPATGTSTVNVNTTSCMGY